MIISASRRTDIPAFYPEWFMNRLRAGWCNVPNPVNPAMVSRVSLRPQDVDAIAFWTKNPAPLLPFLDEIRARGFRFFFLYTLNDYPPELEPCVPPIEERIGAFLTLSRRADPGGVIWRYDPVILSRKLDADYHLSAFARIASALSGHCGRVIVSVVDFYHKTRRRLAAVEKVTGDSFLHDPFAAPDFPRLVRGLVTTAKECGLRIQSCAEEPGLVAHGVEPGKCIDDKWIRATLGIAVTARKDPGQRRLCRCVASRDIGSPDSCLHGCEYCYATRSRELAVERHGRHDPASPAMPAGGITGSCRPARCSR